MSTIKNQPCFTEATASARLILATGLPINVNTDSIKIWWLTTWLTLNTCKASTSMNM